MGRRYLHRFLKIYDIIAIGRDVEAAAARRPRWVFLESLRFLSSGANSGRALR